MVRQDNHSARVFRFNTHSLLMPNLSRSAVKLSYRDAQNILDGKGLNGVAIDGQHQLAAIEQDVKILESVAKKLRADRFKNGALSLDDMKIKFTLDDDGLPTDCVQYEKTESNNLIEEVCATKSRANSLY